MKKVGGKNHKIAVNSVKWSEMGDFCVKIGVLGGFGAGKVVEMSDLEVFWPRKGCLLKKKFKKKKKKKSDIALKTSIPIRFRPFLFHFRLKNHDFHTKTPPKSPKSAPNTTYGGALGACGGAFGAAGGAGGPRGGAGAPEPLALTTHSATCIGGKYM
jgi:hypothetical protein